MNEAGLRELLMDHVRKVCNGTQFYGLPEQLARRQLKELTSIGNANPMFEMQQTAVSLALPSTESTELNLLQPDNTCCVGSALAAAPTAWEMPSGLVRFSGGGYMIFRAWASCFGLHPNTRVQCKLRQGPHYQNLMQVRSFIRRRRDINFRKAVVRWTAITW